MTTSRRFAEAQKARLRTSRSRSCRACRGAEGDPRGCGGLLRARRALQPHRQRHHDRDHGQGGGLQHITACSPPRPGVGVAPAIVYAAHICGADKILAMGGVQGVAAMTFGLFGLPKANILVGPGNQFVAEAKRILFGRVGIDMIAGPTDSLILADKTPTRRSWRPTWSVRPSMATTRRSGWSRMTARWPKR